MEFSLVVGPGNHGKILVEALTPSFEFDYAEYWPKYSHRNANQPENFDGSVFYDFASKIVYGLHHKLRFVTNAKWHQDILYPLYDRINTKRMGGVNLFAWPQVSLYTMQQIKKRGGKVLLEQPMCHVDFWNDMAAKEHDKWKLPDTTSFTKRMTDRIKREYELADNLIVPSSFCRRTFEESGTPKHKIIDCAYGVHLERHAPPVKVRGPVLKVIYVGRVELLKGVQYLVQAIAHLGPKVELNVAGHVAPGMASLLSRSNANVVYHGQLSGSQVRQLYLDADVLVFPSLYDSFGLVVLEAMSHGLPVISTTHSVGNDIIKDGENGFVVPPFSAEAIAERIQWMMSHQQSLMEMAQKASATVRHAFTFEHYQNRIQTIVKNSFFAGKQERYLA